MARKLSLKKYTYDQEKTVYPNLTWQTALNRLYTVYPKESYNFNIIKNTNEYSVVEFSDGSFTQKGKGHTVDQAKASAIMEYIERLCIKNFKFPNGCFKESYSNLNDDYDVKELENCFNINFADNIKKTKKELINTKITWVTAFSIMHKKQTLYPFNFNHYYNSSNGAASGNTMPEAINHALCEIIQKHNIDDFFYNQKFKKPTIVTPESIKSEIALSIIKKLIDEGVNITIYDASKPIDVPTFIIRGYESNYKQAISAQTLGFGTHLNPEIALIKALTEYTQAKEEIKQSPDFSCTKITDNVQHLLSFDLLDAIESSTAESLDTITNSSDESFEADNLEIIRKCAKFADDIIFLSQTDPLLKIPVCRIYVPNFMPGSFIDAPSKNEYWLIHRLIHESGEIEQANLYYRKNFKKMIKKSTKFLSMKFVDVDLNKLKPENCPPNVFAKMLKGIDIKY